MGWFVEVCRRGLKFNADKSKVMVLGGEEGLVCKVLVHETRFGAYVSLNTWDVF